MHVGVGCELHHQHLELLSVLVKADEPAAWHLSFRDVDCTSPGGDVANADLLQITSKSALTQSAVNYYSLNLQKS